MYLHVVPSLKWAGPFPFWSFEFKRPEVAAKPEEVLVLTDRYSVEPPEASPLDEIRCAGPPINVGW